mgnify:CR=1 FL=1
MLVQKDYKFWFCTGSQDLYGDECLAHVAEHSQIIVKALNESGILPYEVVWKPTLITNEVIRRTFNEANTDENCRCYYMVPYILTGKIMDSRIKRTEKTITSPSYTVQP